MEVLLFLNCVWLISAVMASFPEDNLYTMEDDLIEGDIKLLPGQTRASVPNKLWPNGVFVYDIESSLSGDVSVISLIHGAMKEWTDKTKGCIKFRKRKKNERDYVSFYKGAGCWSHLGKAGAKQRLSLGVFCWKHGIIAHEIGHALGFLHEHSRPDRDKYVEIKFENIMPGRENNFRVNYQVDSLGTPYDYGSIMHYGAKAFSINGKPTIVPKKAGVTIGNRKALSPIDVLQMRLLYKCDGSPDTPTPLPPVTSPSSTSFSCDFEERDVCGFKQDKDDKFDWTRINHPTPSMGTGPNGDHTSGKGYYMYIEASGTRPGDNAKISRMVSLTGRSCLQFYYNMYGGNMGTLNVRLSDKVIFTKKRNQGRQWHVTQVRLKGAGIKQLTFEGIIGGGFSGDASIDDIIIFDC